MPKVKRFTAKKQVVIPLHNKDIPIGTLMSILKQSGLDRKEFE